MLSRNPVDVKFNRELEKEAQAVRLALIGELDAINLYVQLADSVKDERVRRVLLDIAEEEKVHVGELMELLKIIDPEQTRALEKAAEEIKELTG